MRSVPVLALALLAAVSASVRAEERIATRPGLMCMSADALAKLTLPDGSSRAALPRPRPEDLRTKAEGGCVDLHPGGSRVTVVESYRLTSKVTADPGDGGGTRAFTIPNVDFASALVEGAAAAPDPATVLGTSTRLGVTISADGLGWCSHDVHLHIRSEGDAALDSADLRGLLQQFAQVVLTRRCPAAASVRYDGRVGNGPPRWQATASAVGGWAVAPTGATASSGPALDLDDLGQAGRLAPSRSASAPAPPAPWAIGACPISYPGSPQDALPLACTCDAAAMESGAVFGTDYYSSDSPPCRAARHAGVLGQDGGTAAFILVPGVRNLIGSDRNGVDSGGANAAPASVLVRPASPKLVAYIRDVTGRQLDPAMKVAVATSDGRLLVADPVPPPAFPDATTAAPAPGVAVDLPDADAVTLPVPPAPLAGGLPAIPWLARQP